MASLTFSGYQWERLAYNNNHPDLSWVDADGFLHVKVGKVNGVWKTGGVRLLDTITTASNPYPPIPSPNWLGFGTYRFDVLTPLNDLDKNLNFALYQYSKFNQPEPHLQYREVDYLEVVRWGLEYTNPAAPPDWYPYRAKTTVFPNISSPLGDGKADENDKTFDITYAGPTTHIGIRKRDSVYYQMSGGGTELFSWKFSSPEPDIWIPQIPLLVYIGFEMYQSRPPSNGLEQEVVVTDFTFTPAEVRLIGNVVCRGGESD
jgi:hypothetical protein